MAAKLHNSHDANMNAVSAVSFSVLHGSAAGGMKRQKDGQFKPITNSMGYRDSRRRDESPARAQQQSSLKPKFEDFDDPPSPTGYDHDRIHNDLLEEICSDIGIKDATDLDIFDFDSTTDQYIIGQTRLPDDLECLDQTIPFGHFGQIQEHQYGGGSGNAKQLGSGPSEGAIKADCQRTEGTGQLGSGVGSQYYLHGDSFQQAPLTDEVKQEVLRARKSSASDCLASPTVSSTCPGSGSGSGNTQAATSSGSRPASISSSMDSPAIHSTGGPRSVESGHYQHDAGMTQLPQHQQQQQRQKGGLGVGRGPYSPMPSPAMSCGSRDGPPSVDSRDFTGPPSVGPDVTSTTPGPSPPSGDDTDDCVLVAAQDKRRGLSHLPPRTPTTPHKLPPTSCHSPRVKLEATPRGPSSCAGAGQPPSSYRGGSTAVAPPSDHGYGSSTGAGGCSLTSGSHYGSNLSLAPPAASAAGAGPPPPTAGETHLLDPMAKDKVFRYLENTPSRGVTTAVDQASGTGSASSSPPQHAAKRARMISSGNDLLEEMRERYAFTKGADMYAPSHHPDIDGGVPVPVQRNKMASQVYQGPGGKVATPNTCSASADNKPWGPQDAPQCNFQFSQTPKMNFVNPGAGGSGQPKVEGEGQPFLGSCAASGRPTNSPSLRESCMGGYQDTRGGGGGGVGYAGVSADPHSYGDVNRSLSMPCGGGDSSQYAGSSANVSAGQQQLQQQQQQRPGMSSMYGSCPNLTPQQNAMAESGAGMQYPTPQGYSQGGRPYSPSTRVTGLTGSGGAGMRPPSAGSYGGTQNYSQYPGASNSPVPQQQQQQQQPQQGMHYGNVAQPQDVSMTTGRPPPSPCSLSAPNTPSKHANRQNNMYLSQQQQQQWNVQNNQMNAQSCYNSQSGQDMVNGQPMRMGPMAPGQPMRNQYGMNSQQSMSQHQQQQGANGNMQMPDMNMQNMQMQPQTPGVGGGVAGRGNAMQYPNQCMAGTDMSTTMPGVTAAGPDGVVPPQGLTPGESQGGYGGTGGGGFGPLPPNSVDIPISQHGFMQRLISDRSSSFRSHPLFPLLRDLIIADMNFHTPSFPFALIANLPADFERLLQNYLQRNPPLANMTRAEAVQGVIMDALKYAHRALIEKIQQRKQKEGYKEPAKSLTAIEDFCERFDRAVKNSMSKSPYPSPFPEDHYPGGGSSGAVPPQAQPQIQPQPQLQPQLQTQLQPQPQPQPQPHPHPHPGGMGQACGSSLGNMTMPPPQHLPPGHHHHSAPHGQQQQQHQHQQHHPQSQQPLHSNHSQSYHDLSGSTPRGMPPYHPHHAHPHHPHFGGLHGSVERRASSLPASPRKPPFHAAGRLHCADSAGVNGDLRRSDSNLSGCGVGGGGGGGGDKSQGNTGSGSTATGKSKVLPKEAVAYMMDWLRAHQDNPYPNDDEKEMLIQKTKLTINQINYWFTNARRRILPKWALQRYMEQQQKQEQESQQPSGAPQFASPSIVGAKH